MTKNQFLREVEKKWVQCMALEGPLKTFLSVAETLWDALNTENLKEQIEEDEVDRLTDRWSLSFNTGMVLKYFHSATVKYAGQLHPVKQDLENAKYYIQKEIDRITRMMNG